MGAFCSCFHVSDARDNAPSNSSVDDCYCPRCFFRRFLNKNLFTKGQIRVVTARNQPASLPNTATYNHTVDATDSHDGMDSYIGISVKSEQGSTYGSEEQSSVPVQLRVNFEQRSTDGSEAQSSSPVQLKVYFEQGNTDGPDEQSPTPLAVKSEVADACPSDNEDVCPTCLEEYSPENPKITAKCAHHYHLSCIYEWMERSIYCPACNKLMLFEDSS